jgi:hypothetical protein
MGFGSTWVDPILLYSVHSRYRDTRSIRMKDGRRLNGLRRSYSVRPFSISISPFLTSIDPLGFTSCISTSRTPDDTHASTGDDVWLGGNVTILGGVRIGSGSTIGAGSVITKDVPPRSVVVGNPGRVVRTLPELSGGEKEVLQGERGRGKEAERQRERMRAWREVEE